jgi:hypothetical protein
MSITKSKFLLLQKKTRKKRLAIRNENQKLKNGLSNLAQLKKELENEQAKGTSASNSILKTLHGKTKKIQEENIRLKENIKDIEGGIYLDLDTLIFSADPRDQVAMLDDSYPIFLTPVRVETRFVTVKHITRINKNQLPTTSQPTYTIVNGQPVAQPTNHSVKRIFKDVDKVPVIDDVQELWIRIFPDDIAVHTHEEELTQTEVTAAQTFWKHIWHAGANESLRIGAWRGMVSGRGPERAAWIAKIMTPLNPEDKPVSEITENSDLPVVPEFPAIDLRETTWSQAPHTRIMPDRFVVRLHNIYGYREVIGENIPDTLHLGIDPKTEDNEITSDNGGIELKDKIKWLQDFDEAEKVGMGIRVPLFSFDSWAGFDKILVLGVKTSADKDEGKELLEDLLNNHHYTHGGLSVVPQGTPTNNTETAESGYTAYNANEEILFNIELGDNQFEPTATDKLKTDGQHLADALGISYDTVQHVQNAGQTDVMEAMCMNRALWPVTFGYYLPQMMHPIFPENEIDKTKNHFNQYVLGRGRIPTIRVDDQPYGILPVTAFSKWTYNTNSTNDRFLDKMFKNVLTPMDSTWQRLAYKVSTADSSTNQANAEKLFLDVLGLHASSVEFYQRYVTGPFLLWNIYNYSAVINGTVSRPAQASYASSLVFFKLFGDQDFFYVFPPRLFDFFYSTKHKYLNGPVIDPKEFSEEKKLSIIGANEENYINWLLKSNWWQIKKEDFSTIGAPNRIPPKSLLYLMLRHSALLEYNKTGLLLLKDNGLVTDLKLIDTEFTNLSTNTLINPELKNIVHASVAFKEGVKSDKKLEKLVEAEFTRRNNSGELAGMGFRALKNARSEFKNALRAAETPKILAKADKAANKILEVNEFVTSNKDLLFKNHDFLDGVSVADHIAADLLKPKAKSKFANMHELMDNLECLADLPTARLERCFSEHIDLASYRLDAWFYSLVLERLQKLRKTGVNRKEGVYIGAYAWLEKLTKGKFPAIHYREVDISPERVLIPGINSVSIKDSLDTNIKFSAAKSYEFNIKRTKKNNAAAPIVRLGGSTTKVDGANMIVISTLLETDTVLGNQGYIRTGGNTMVIDAVRDQLTIGNPGLLDVPIIRDLGPSYAYLGKNPGGVGKITYDQVTDRFINAPREDPGNQGYIHAPSIDHATTAAVLRAGYESHKLNTGSPEDTLALKINSDRVRKTLYYLEGVNNGQELGALLGYQFERGLHDKDMGLDAYILEFRLKYPFVAGRVTNNTGITNIESAEAYNVVNGLALIENSGPSNAFPYGVEINGPISNVQRNAIIAEVEKLHDSMDGINDLLMAESMHQVVLGNYPKASAVLKAMGGEPLAIDPDVIKTPRNFNILNHRFGSHFNLSGNGHKIWTTIGTPRALAEPHLNRWLASILPPPSQIKINIQHQIIEADGALGAQETNGLSLEDLNFEAIDLYYMSNPTSDEGNTQEMLNRINFYVRDTFALSDSVNVEVSFSDRTGLVDTEMTLFELQGLLDHLHEVIGNSRPLRPHDFLLSDAVESTVEANPELGLETSLLLARIQDVLKTNMSNGGRGFEGVIEDLKAGIAAAETIVDDTSPIIGNELDVLRVAMQQAALFGTPNAIPQTAKAVSLSIKNEMYVLAKTILTQMEDRKIKADSGLAKLAEATSKEGEIRRLEAIAKDVFGRAFKVFPEYRLYNEGQIDAANKYPDYLNYVGEHAIIEWFQGLSPVRKRMHAFQQTSLLAKAIEGHDDMMNLALSQIPLLPIDETANPKTRWLGLEFPEDYEMPDENIAMIFFNPNGYSASGLQAGIMIDEWVEEIPDKVAHTGISVHFDNPNSEPAQTCLLAISPNLDGKWSWDDLMDTLSETLDWAKKRAVDPDLLNDSIYPQVLPALYAAISASDETPTLDFGRNIVKKPKNGNFGLIKTQLYDNIIVDFDNPFLENL